MFVSVHSTSQEAETQKLRIDGVLSFTDMHGKFNTQITVHGADHSKPGLTGSFING